jgi:hypothetical protein
LSLTAQLGEAAILVQQLQAQLCAERGSFTSDSHQAAARSMASLPALVADCSGKLVDGVDKMRRNVSQHNFEVDGGTVLAADAKELSRLQRGARRSIQRSLTDDNATSSLAADVSLIKSDVATMLSTFPKMVLDVLCAHQSSLTHISTSGSGNALLFDIFDDTSEADSIDVEVHPTLEVVEPTLVSLPSVTVTLAHDMHLPSLDGDTAAGCSKDTSGRALKHVATQVAAQRALGRAEAKAAEVSASGSALIVKGKAYGRLRSVQTACSISSPALPDDSAVFLDALSVCEEDDAFVDVDDGHSQTTDLHIAQTALWLTVTADLSEDFSNTVDALQDVCQEIRCGFAETSGDCASGSSDESHDAGPLVHDKLVDTSCSEGIAPESEVSFGLVTLQGTGLADVTTTSCDGDQQASEWVCWLAAEAWQHIPTEPCYPAPRPRMVAVEIVATQDVVLREAASAAAAAAAVPSLLDQLIQLKAALSPDRAALLTVADLS